MTNQNNFKNVSTEAALEMLKRETAQEMGVELGADTSARMNGAVGGRVTQKLIQLGEMALVDMMQEQGIGNVELSQMLNESNNHTELH